MLLLRSQKKGVACVFAFVLQSYMGKDRKHVLVKLSFKFYFQIYLLLVLEPLLPSVLSVSARPRPLLLFATLNSVVLSPEREVSLNVCHHPLLAHPSGLVSGKTYSGFLAFYQKETSRPLGDQPLFQSLCG